MKTATITALPSANNVSVVQADGFHAAEQWYAAFKVAADKAGNSYMFPSGLRQAFAALPASARNDFLDGIGALMVSWTAYGEPVPEGIDLREEMRVSGMTADEQDKWFDPELEAHQPHDVQTSQKADRPLSDAAPVKPEVDMLMVGEHLEATTHEREDAK